MSTLHPQSHIDIAIVPAGPGDAAAIAALHAESWRSAYAGILPASFLDGPAVVEDRVAIWRGRLLPPAAGQPDRTGPGPPLSRPAARDRMLVHVARSSAGILGFACVRLDAEPAFGPLLDNLHVTPSLKGHGIGRRLFEHARAAAHAVSGETRFHLWVFESNAPARRFYESLGGTASDRCTVVIGGRDVLECRYLW